jgi:hypothetical protein
VRTVQWICSKAGPGFVFDESQVFWDGELVYPMTLALRGGHCGIVQLMHDRSIHFLSTTRREAAKSGSVQLLALLKQLDLKSWTGREGEDLHLETYSESLEECLCVAGQCGHTDVVAYLVAHGAQWPQQLWQRDADEAGQLGEASCWALPALQYAIAAGCQLGEWPIGLCDELIANNYADEVEWLHTLEAPPCGASCSAKQQ